MKEAANQAASIQPRALGAPLSDKIPERRTCNREQHHNNSTDFHGLIERSIFNVGDVVIDRERRMDMGPFSPFTAGPRLDDAPRGDPRTQAIAALRGYAYQLYASALAWLDPRPGQELYLEVAKDYAVTAVRL